MTVCFFKLFVWSLTVLFIVSVSGAQFLDNKRSVEIKPFDDSMMMSKFISHLIKCLHKTKMEKSTLSVASKMEFKFDVFAVSFDYLDVSSIANMSKCNRYYKCAMECLIRNTIHRFLPGLLTDEPILNNILFSFIRFLGITDLNDPDRFDAVEMINAKFVLEKYQFKNFPKSFYHVIILFFYEVVFGSDVPVPFKNNTVILNMYRNLQVYDLPKSSKVLNNYFINTFKLQSDELVRTKSQQFLIYFASKPEKDVQLELYRNDYSHKSFGSLNQVDKLVKVFLIENCAGLFSEAELAIIRGEVTECCRGGLIMHTLFQEMVFNNVESPFHDISYIELVAQNYTVHRVATATTITTVSSMFCRYWAERSAQNPFSFDEFDSQIFETSQSFSCNNILNMTYGNCYTDLCKFDTLVKVLKSGRVNLDLQTNSFQHAREYICTNRPNTMLDFVLLAYPFPINFISRDAISTDDAFYFAFSHVSKQAECGVTEPIDTDKFKIILSYIRSKYNNDPLPLLFFDRNFLLQHKSLILSSGPFNFKNTYKIDMSMWSYLYCKYYTFDSSDKLNDLLSIRGKVLTCQDLLKFFDLEEVFVEDPQILLNIEYNLDQEPISVLRFIDKAEILPAQPSPPSLYSYEQWFLFVSKVLNLYQ